MILQNIRVIATVDCTLPNERSPEKVCFWASKTSSPARSQQKNKHFLEQMLFDAIGTKYKLYYHIHDNAIPLLNGNVKSPVFGTFFNKPPPFA